MSPLFDGLLDPEHDLHLISLALTSPTHAALAHQALLRPPTFSTNLHLSPLPPHSTSPSDPHSQYRALAHHHISLNKLILLIPPLRIPWASSLATTLRTHLSVSLQVVRSRAARPTSLLASLARREPITPEAAAQFYSPLSSPDSAYNSVILAYIRKQYHPHALDRLATAVKLAFAHSLLRALRSEARVPLNRLQVLKQPQPSQTVSAKRTQTSALVHDAWRVHDTELTPRRRRLRGGIIASGRWVRDATRNPHSYLLDGVAIPAALTSTVASLLAQRYAVHVDVSDHPRDHHLGSLASLSNSGTALLRAARGGDRCRLAPRIGAIPTGRGPAFIAESVDRYLEQRFGLRWRTVCAELVREAKQMVEREEMETLPDVIRAQNDAIREADQIRTALIRRAILHETAGKSLVRMCAFAMAQQEGTGDVERELEEFPDEYRQVLREAKIAIQQLKAGCAEPVGRQEDVSEAAVGEDKRR